MEGKSGKGSRFLPMAFCDDDGPSIYPAKIFQPGWRLPHSRCLYCVPPLATPPPPTHPAHPGYNKRRPVPAVGRASLVPAPVFVCQHRSAPLSAPRKHMAAVWNDAGVKRLSRLLAFPARQVHEAHCADFYQPEAAVRVTAFCESVLRDVLTNGIRATTSSLLTEAHMLRSFEGGGGTRADAKRRHRRHLRSKPGQLTARHLQIGLHLDVDLHAMCDCSPRLGAVILAYLDQETEALLRGDNRAVAASSAAASAKSSSAGGRGRRGDDRGSGGGGDGRDDSDAGWARRSDDAITDSDLSKVLSRLHPAYSLANDARLFLCSLTRELLAESLETERSAEPQVSIKLVGGHVGARAHAAAQLALDRYAGATPHRGTGSNEVRLRLVFRRLGAPPDDESSPSSASSKSSLAHDIATVATCRLRHPRHQAMADALARACERLKCKQKDTVFVWGGRLVDGGRTPEGLDMEPRQIEDIRRSGEVRILSGCEVFVVARKWWVFKQREQAR